MYTRSEVVLPIQIQYPTSCATFDRIFRFRFFPLPFIFGHRLTLAVVRVDVNVYIYMWKHNLYYIHISSPEYPISVTIIYIYRVPKLDVYNTAVYLYII